MHFKQMSDLMSILYIIFNLFISEGKHNQREFNFLKKLNKYNLICLHLDI